MTDAAKTSTMIELTDEQYANLISGTRAPSPYEADVKAAKPGKGYAIEVKDDGPVSRSIVSNLHKAAKAVGVKVQVNTKLSLTPPLVVWAVVPADTEEVAPAAE